MQVRERLHYSSFETAKRLVVAVTDTRKLFPKLVTKRAEECLARLAVAHTELERIKNYVARNRDE